MASKSHGNAVGVATATRLDELQDAMATLDSTVADIPTDANTRFVDAGPAAADMDAGYVYIWPDADGNLVVGGLDADTGTKEIIQLDVSAGSDGGIIGGIVGGLI